MLLTLLMNLGMLGPSPSTTSVGLAPLPVAEGGSYNGDYYKKQELEKERQKSIIEEDEMLVEILKMFMQ